MGRGPQDRATRCGLFPGQATPSLPPRLWALLPWWGSPGWGAGGCAAGSRAAWASLAGAGRTAARGPAAGGWTAGGQTPPPGGPWGAWATSGGRRAGRTGWEHCAGDSPAPRPAEGARLRRRLGRHMTRPRRYHVGPARPRPSPTDSKRSTCGGPRGWTTPPPRLLRSAPEQRGAGRAARRAWTQRPQSLLRSPRLELVSTVPQDPTLPSLVQVTVVSGKVAPARGPRLHLPERGDLPPRISAP